MKTKAVVFPGPDKFEVMELTLPDELKPGYIKVKTLVSAISPGTERWILRGKHIGTEFPCVPGYHRIGIVEECADDVTTLQPCDIVYGGAPALWEEKEIKSMWGAHIGYSVADAANYKFLSSTPMSNFELQTVAFTILIGVANRGIRFCSPNYGDTMLIIGGGIIGICAAQLAQARGSRPLILDKDHERVNFIKNTMNIDAVCSDDSNLDSEFKTFAPCGFDIMYDTVGHAPTNDRIVQFMRFQGTILLQAQYFNKEMCAIDLDQIKIRELTIKTTIGTDEQDFYDTKNNIFSRRLKVAPLITHKFTSDELLKGYEILHTGKPFNLGIVFMW